MRSCSTAGQHHWQSMGTLERTKFVRLRKGYASVRKSFRLAEKSYIQEPVGFMGQLGSRLLRTMRQSTLGAKATANHETHDTPVEGSFRILSGSGLAGDNSSHQMGPNTVHRKSDVELDIEQRLKRSKRRTLPSSRCHRTPAAEAGQAIYEELNLDELEAIKRDNLRLTLRGGRALEPAERRGGCGVQPMCSCKSLDPGSGLPDSFCCCKSASSSSSSPPVSPSCNVVGKLAAGASSSDCIDGSEEEPPLASNQAAICDQSAASAPDTAHGFKFFEGQQQVVASATAVAFNGSLGGAKQGPIVANGGSPQVVESRANGSRATHVSDFPTNNKQLQLNRSSKVDVLEKNEEVQRSRQQALSQPEVDSHKLHRRGRAQPAASSMRAAKSEWMLSRATGGDEFECGLGPVAREEHYEPLPNANQHRQAQVRYWTRRLSGYEDYAEQQDDLFERQLYAAALNERQHNAMGSQKRLNVKRSLLSKIKQFIVPSSTAKETLTNRANSPQDSGYMNGQNNRRTFAHSTLNLAAGSCSTSNYLTTAGRKSINLVNYDLSPSSKNQLGFLTLGRQQATKNALRPTASTLFRPDNNVKAPHQYGSMDSLPSADSGLSSSNLQNLNEEQHYSRIYSTVEAPSRQETEPPITGGGGGGGEEEKEMSFVGRAIAKVDCNPCAYDKEALVFKRGDVIDIIERHHSGTWVGRCHGLVGHFKFINVAELQEEEEEEEEAQPTEGGPSFVTKLEIRNDSNERLNGQHSPHRDASNQKPVVYYNGRQQMSQPSIPVVAPAAGGAGRQLEVNQIRTQKSQEAASTLEQLLFAIGLANEQVASHQQQQQQVSTTATTRCLSYLDIMNSAGLDSLESFSNINDCSKLEQIGIHNHEHQQRLLMAARIIRRASEAAKLDFIQNYQTSSVSQHHNQSTTRQQAPPPTNSVRPTSRRSTTTTAKTEYHEEARCNLNEPIYVNLVNGRLEETPLDGIHRVPTIESKEGWQAQDSNHQSVAFQRHNQSAKLSAQLYQPQIAKLDQTPVRGNLFSNSNGSFFDENGNAFNVVNQNQELEDLSELAWKSANEETNEKLPSELSVFEQLYSTAKENASLHKVCFNPLPSKRSKCSSFAPVTRTVGASYTAEHLKQHQPASVHSQTMDPTGAKETIINSSSSQQHQHQFNNRSQINPPTSAYDLRLDLSHFFS